MALIAGAFIKMPPIQAFGLNGSFCRAGRSIYASMSASLNMTKTFMMPCVLITLPLKRQRCGITLRQFEHFSAKA